MSVKIDPVKVIFDSASKVLAEPEPVITLLFALLFIVVAVTPLNPEPSPINEVAVTIPEKVAFPFDLMVAAVPTSKPSVALTIPTTLVRPEVTRSFSPVPPV